LAIAASLYRRATSGEMLRSRTAPETLSSSQNSRSSTSVAVTTDAIRWYRLGTGASEFTCAALGVHGTVLADGEMLDSSRARAAAGPGDALAFHFAYEAGADVAALPGGQAWPEVIGRVPEHETHLAVHDQHLVGLNDADEAAWAARSWAAIPTTTVTGSARQLRQRLSAFAAEGITEIVYQPTGPDTRATVCDPKIEA
jgi:hypothetical protein